MRRVLIIASVILVLIVFITLRFVINQRTRPTEIAALTAKPVEVIKAKRGEIRNELKLSGTIEANSNVTVFFRRSQVKLLKCVLTKAAECERVTP